MTICEAIAMGRAGSNPRAIRQSSWPEGVFAYHGMDNQLFVHNPLSDEFDKPLSMAVATLLAFDWELSSAPYHGLQTAYHDVGN